MAKLLIVIAIGLVQIVPSALGFRWFGVDLNIKNGLSHEEVNNIRQGDQDRHDAHVDKLHQGYDQINSMNTELYNEVVSKLLNGTDKVTDLHEQAGKLVESFIQQHLEFADKSAANHHNQTLIIQQKMTELVDEFVNDNHKKATEVLNGYRNHSIESQTMFNQLMQDFRIKATNADNAYNTMIQNQMNNHQTMVQKFLNDSHSISSTGIQNFQNTSGFMLYGGIGCGLFLVVILTILVFKRNQGSKRHDPYAVHNYPQRDLPNYPPVYSPPGYEMVSLKRNENGT